MYTEQERINRLEHLSKESDKRIKELETQVRQLSKCVDAVSSRTFGQIMIGSV
jgi:hypothetical protein